MSTKTKYVLELTQMEAQTILDDLVEQLVDNQAAYLPEYRIAALSVIKALWSLGLRAPIGATEMPQ